jgi:phosphotriesterase-related protein
MTELERKVFRAVGKAHVQTGLPIFTHTASGTGPQVPADAGLRQLDVLESVGVDPKHVVIGHMCCDDEPTVSSIKAIAKRGAFVGFDRVTGGLVSDEKKVRMIVGFLDAGHAAHLVLSSDFTGKKTPLGAGEVDPGQLNYGITLTVFLPKLRAAGVSDALLQVITRDNPRRFLAFVPKV